MENKVTINRQRNSEEYFSRLKRLENEFSNSELRILTDRLKEVSCIHSYLENSEKGNPVIKCRIKRGYKEQEELCKAGNYFMLEGLISRCMVRNDLTISET